MNCLNQLSFDAEQSGAASSFLFVFCKKINIFPLSDSLTTLWRGGGAAGGIQQHRGRLLLLAGLHSEGPLSPRLYWRQEMERQQSGVWRDCQWSEDHLPQLLLLLLHLICQAGQSSTASSTDRNNIIIRRHYRVIMWSIISADRLFLNNIYEMFCSISYLGCDVI